MPTPKRPPGKYQWIDANIFARGRKRGGVVYGISYHYRGRRRLETVGPSITLARSALAARRGEIAQGRFRLESTRRLPRFPDFAQQYLEDHSKPTKRSWERDAWALKKAVEFFGNRRLDEITAWDVERYRAHRLETVSIATANRDVALMKHLLGSAVRWGLLSQNPASDVKLGREQERPFRVLSQDEEVRLLSACAPHLAPIVLMALNTGLRHGELLALEWRDVNLRRGTLEVRRSKSGKVRTVPLNDAALGVLLKIPGRDGAVFRFEGRAVRWVDTAFRAAVRRSGIATLRFHDLRHTFISRLVHQGVALPVIQRLAGHSTIITTMRYAHVTTDQARAAVAKLQHAPKDEGNNET